MVCRACCITTLGALCPSAPRAVWGLVYVSHNGNLAALLMQGAQSLHGMADLRRSLSALLEGVVSFCKMAESRLAFFFAERLRLWSWLCSMEKQKYSEYSGRGDVLQAEKYMGDTLQFLARGFVGF